MLVMHVAAPMVKTNASPILSSPEGFHLRMMGTGRARSMMFVATSRADDAMCIGAGSRQDLSVCETGVQVKMSGKISAKLEPTTRNMVAKTLMRNHRRRESLR